MQFALNPKKTNSTISQQQQHDLSLVFSTSTSSTPQRSVGDLATGEFVIVSLSGEPTIQYAPGSIHTPPPTKPTHKSRKQRLLSCHQPPPAEEMNLAEHFVSPFQHAAKVRLYQIVLAVVIGMGLGTLLTRYHVDGDTAKWVKLPGSLFIQAIECLVAPLIFCSIITVVAELASAGKALQIGSRCVFAFVCASISSALIGTTTGVLFMGFFTEQTHPSTLHPAPVLSFRCPNGKFLSMSQNGTVSCSQTNMTSPQNYFAMPQNSTFFVLQGDSDTMLSLSDQLFGILESLVPSNIINSFGEQTTLSVITFSIVFGISLAKTHARRSKKAAETNHMLLLINQGNLVFQMLVSYVVRLIPLAVVSLIAGSLAEYHNSLEMLKSVGFLILALTSGLLIFQVLVMGIVLFVTTRRNILVFLRQMTPAMGFVFGSSSSIATLPINIRCVDMTREVSRPLTRFILTLGASCNLNGTAIYMPLACIFMAKLSGMEDQITPVNLVILTLVSSISSFGVAPVPHAGLVMVMTVWRTVFGVSMPAMLPLLVGSDWILNRLRAIVNVVNDAVIARIIAQYCEEALDEEHSQFVVESP